MSVTGGIMAGVGLAGSIGVGAISSNAAGNAASEQAQAANNAAQLQYQASQNALDFQKQQYNQNQANLQPWLQSGSGALSNLDYLLGITPQSPSGALASAPTSTPTGQRAITVGAGSAIGRPGLPVSISSMPITGVSRPGAPVAKSSAPPGTFSATPSSSPGTGYGSLLAPYPSQFTAPTGLTEQNDPGYQARLALGTQAMQQSAAARGSLLTGGTAQALDQLGQDYASNEYNNVYNRALNTYATNYNAYNQNQANQYNRLAGIAGVGQQAAGQLGTLGQSAANGISSNLLNTASMMGQQGNNAAAANASGLVGSANAWSGALGGASNNLNQLLLLRQLTGGSNAAPVSNQNELTGAGF